MLLTKFQVNWPFCSGKEAKNKLSKWPPRRLSWISDRNDFSYFWSTRHLDASYQVSSHGGHHGLPIGTILTIFDLQVTRCLLPCCKSIGLLVQEKKRNIFSRLLPSWIPIGTSLAIFDLQVTPMPPTMFQVNWRFGSGEEAKYNFQMAATLDSDRNDFSYF